MSDADFYRRLADLIDAGQACATARIVSSSGATPNEVTAKMLISADGQLLAGTIGGGTVEHKVLATAAEAIAAGEKSRMFDTKLTEREVGGVGMMCGGQVQIFIEVHGRAPKLVLLGAGHINRSLARLVDGLGYHVVVVDERRAWANAENYPNAEIINANPEDVLSELGIDQTSYVIIATPDRDTPALVAAAATDAGYIGMVAAKRKTIRILGDIADRVDIERLATRLSSPIGIELGGHSPEAVALSILAEVQAHRYGATRRTMSLSPEELKRHALRPLKKAE